jgi:ubiquinol-cytochrome c reductase cytochrome c subunit
MNRLQAGVIVLVAGLATAVGVSGQTPAPARPAPAPQGASAANAEAGRKLFVSYGCYQCHGYEAQGSSATGPRLGPRPLQFAALSKYVRAPTGQMPPYTAKVLPDADLTIIYAFLQSRPAPQAVEDIPLLK